MTVAMILLGWVLVSIPVALAVGKLFAYQDIDAEVHEMTYKTERMQWLRQIDGL